MSHKTIPYKDSFSFSYLKDKAYRLQMVFLLSGAMISFLVYLFLPVENAIHKYGYVGFPFSVGWICYAWMIMRSGKMRMNYWEITETEAAMFGIAYFFFGLLLLVFSIFAIID